MSAFFEAVTKRIVETMERGVLPWVSHWKEQDHAPRDQAGQFRLPLRHDGKMYHGINVLILWMAAQEKGYCSPYWMTYKQAASYGGQVRKGEKAEQVCYFGRAKATSKDEAKDEAGEAEQKSFRFIKTYFVFNVAQIDGLPEIFTKAVQPTQKLPLPTHAFEGIVARHKVQIFTGTFAAYYPNSDLITMPHVSAFDDPLNFQRTLAHELIHWTGHESRLDRIGIKSRYSKMIVGTEELVAELGAAFLCAAFNMEALFIEDHARYLQSWITTMKQDSRYIFSITAAAQKAYGFLDDIEEEAISEAVAA